MKIVYVAISGEFASASRIEGIYFDLQKAIKKALSVKCCFPGGWKATENPRWWNNGCDYVRIQEMEVIE